MKPQMKKRKYNKSEMLVGYALSLPFFYTFCYFYRSPVLGSGFRELY